MSNQDESNPAGNKPPARANTGSHGVKFSGNDEYSSTPKVVSPKSTPRSRVKFSGENALTGMLSPRNDLATSPASAAESPSATKIRKRKKTPYTGDLKSSLAEFHKMEAAEAVLHAQREVRTEEMDRLATSTANASINEDANTTNTTTDADANADTSTSSTARKVTIMTPTSRSTSPFDLPPQ